MDFAMRRRFTWKEVTPDDTQDMLDLLGSLADEAKVIIPAFENTIEMTNTIAIFFLKTFNI